MTAYFFSGLGADERVFKHLQLPASWKIVYMKWLPVEAGETLASYAVKYLPLFDTSELFVIVGLSFGGILTTEIIKHIQPHKAVLLSSIASRKELPFSFRGIGKLGINKWVPSQWLNKVYPFTPWYFGVTIKEDERILKSVIHDTPPAFLRWAINEILNWKTDQRHPKLIHLHGSKDRVFPNYLTHADAVIQGGGHFIVLTHANEVSDWLVQNIGTAN